MEHENSIDLENMKIVFSFRYNTHAILSTNITFVIFIKFVSNIFHNLFGFSFVRINRRRTCGEN